MCFGKEFRHRQKSNLLIAAIIFFLSACGGNGGSNGGGGTNDDDSGTVGDGQLGDKIETIREKHNLPALAAFVVQGDSLMESTAQGLRSVDDNIAVTTQDYWHLGSITKSMTATLAAFLVEQGHIEWDSTISDVFPEWRGQILPKYLNIELQQLLSMTSGLDRDADDDNPVFDDLDESLFADDKGPQLRYEGGRRVLSYDHDNPVNQYLYSNIGYVIAGAMLEKQMQQGWRSLIEDSVFTPLGISEFGFGAPGTEGLIDQPLGHTVDNGQLEPVFGDNPTYLDPAGRVHISLADLAQYAIFHLNGFRGEGQMLSEDTFAMLYSSRSNANYALGWEVSQSQLRHDGSNTIWLAELVINKDKDYAIFAVTNASNNAADIAIREALALLSDRIP